MPLSTITQLQPFNINTSATFSFASTQVTANVTAGNIKTDNILYANGSPWVFGSTYSNSNVSSYLPTYTGNVSANYFIGNGSSLTHLTGGNIDGQVANAIVAGTVYTNAQPNITSVGTLSSLTVSGVITSTGGIKVGNIQDPSGTNTVSLLSGNVSMIGDLQVGTGGTGNVTATYFIGNGSQLVGLPAGYANSDVANYLPTYTGSLVNLAGLSVSNATGVVDFTTTANVTLGAVANLHISGGTTGQVLSTDGAGTLSWATAGGGGGGATLSSVAASTTYYIGLTANTSGTWTDARVDTTNLSYDSGTQTLYATNYNTSSDLTLKTNIHTIENALLIVNLLRGVGFDWTETSLKSYGIIAQELEKIIPELVNTDKNGRKTVNYNALIGFLIEAIKTQSLQIKNIEERITLLETR